MATLFQILFINLFLIVSFFSLDISALAGSKQHISDIFNDGLNKISQENYQQALIDFSQVINLQNTLVGAAYSNRCLANLKLQNYVAAEADCTNAIKNDSDNIETHLNLGLAYYGQGKFPQSIAEYQQIIKLEVEEYRAYYNRGLVYFALNNYQQAIVDYRTALMFSPDSHIESKSLIYNDLALTYMMLAEDKQAIFNFNRAIALNIKNYNIYFNRGCAHHRQGEYEAAIADFSQVVKLQPNFTQAYVNRAILQHQIGQKEAAFRDINIALQQYQSQGDSKQYNSVFHLKEQLFYVQPSQWV